MDALGVLTAAGGRQQQNRQWVGRWIVLSAGSGSVGWSVDNSRTQTGEQEYGENEVDRDRQRIREMEGARGAGSFWGEEERETGEGRRQRKTNW